MDRCRTSSVSFMVVVAVVVVWGGGVVRNIAIIILVYINTYPSSISILQ